MFDINVYAIRSNGVVNVTVSGTSPNSCHEIKITDFYPGGKINYIRDPGVAQVFLEETIKPSSSYCLMILLPWARHAIVPDLSHEKVVVYINGNPVASADIQEVPTSYRVIALTASDGPNYKACSVIPADSNYLSIYSSVFGPASKEECEDWVKKNCNT